MGFIKEFKEFAMKGNVMDMAVGVIIGAAFGKIVSSMVDDILMPLVGMVTGNVDFTSGWTLAGGATGMATILFIPTKYAAPTEPQDYAFGGSFSYTDPFTGLTVTRNLNPVTLTVKPSPDLDLTYFLQRDVLGDDPQTEEIEPMVPAEFALVVNNKGYGDVPNMTLTTEQPKIVDNQKNLVINFEIIGSQLNGGEKALALGGSTISNFGTIPGKGATTIIYLLKYVIPVITLLIFLSGLNIIKL